MFPDAREVRLGPDERAELEARLRAPTSEQRHVFRARIVLMAAEGLSTRAIARNLGTMPRTVSYWRIRFAEKLGVKCRRTRFDGSRVRSAGCSGTTSGRLAGSA